MTNPTHRSVGVNFAYIGSVAINELGYNPIQSKQYPLLSFVILTILMYWGCSKGCLFPDDDHDKKNIKVKTAINLIISNIIHFTGGKHRSWQTHSIDIWLISYVVLMLLTKNMVYYDILQKSIYMILTAFWLGWGSHLFADALSMQGVRIFCWNNDLKIRFVPKSGKVSKKIPIYVLTIGLIGAIIVSYFINLTTGIMIAILGFMLMIFIAPVTRMTFKTGLDFTDDTNWEVMVYKAMHSLEYVGLGIVIIYGLVLSNKMSITIPKMNFTNIMNFFK